MERKSAERDIVARAPYRPPVAASTRTGGRRTAMRAASAGLILGITIVAGVALSGAWSSGPVEVRFRPPQAPAPPAAPVAAPAAPGARLVIDRAARRVTLLRHGAPAWRARGPIDCVSGRRWRSFRDRPAIVARACVRLRSGAVVGLAGRVPRRTALHVR
jgi:hypothetical protein